VIVHDSKHLSEHFLPSEDEYFAWIMQWSLASFLLYYTLFFMADGTVKMSSNKLKLHLGQSNPSLLGAIKRRFAEPDLAFNMAFERLEMESVAASLELRVAELTIP